MGHYYTHDGEPQHYQVTASGKNKGKKRGTTIRDAKKYKLLPSVSEICSQLESNGLTTWKIRQALTHGHEIAGQHKFPEATETFIGRATGMLKEETEGYADFGSMVHDAIERYIKSEISGVPENFTLQEVSYIDRWNSVLHATFPDFVYLGTEVPFGNSTLGYGGCVDVLGYDRTLGVFAVPDLKTKKTKENTAFYISEKYPLQLCAYRDGFNQFDKLDFSKCPEALELLKGRSHGFPAETTIIGNLYLSSTEETRQEWVEIPKDENETSSKTFSLLRQMYFLRKNYDPTEVSTKD